MSCVLSAYPHLAAGGQLCLGRREVQPRAQPQPALSVALGLLCLGGPPGLSREPPPPAPDSEPGLWQQQTLY